MSQITDTSSTNDTSSRVIRGASWSFTFPTGVRAAYRSTYAPTNRYGNLGFRCALRVRQPVGKVRL